MRNFIFLIFSMLFVNNSFGQLSTKHWISPIHTRQENQVEDHYIYLSTPVAIAFEVNITNGRGDLIGGSPITISKDNPATIFIGNGVSSPMFVLASQLNISQSNKGIILEGRNPFYTSFRVRSVNQAGYLTSKGTLGRGTSFRLGSFPQEREVQSRNFYASVMATEDDTVVTFSDYDTAVAFQTGSGTISSPTVISPVLNAGDTFTVSGYTNVVANLDGFVGALVTSTKPITVNSGNALGALGSSNGQDFGIDQIVPERIVGQEYVVIEGAGIEEIERPIVIATQPNTEVFINDAVTPTTILNSAGDYFLIPNSFYVGSSPNHQNMRIFTSKPSYVYQSIAGSNRSRGATSGMNFIPPLNCLLLTEVDLIPSINTIGFTNYDADIIAITTRGSQLSINDEIVMDTPENVIGNPEWVTYRVGGFLPGQNSKVTSTGPLSVGVFGFNDLAGFGGYYSGFGFDANELEIELCVSDGDINVLSRIPGNLLSGGVWTPNFASGTNIFNPNTDISGRYNYQLANSCAAINVDVIIDVNDLPVLGMVSSIPVCSNLQISDPINLAMLESELLNGLDPLQYPITYFETFSDATNNSNELTPITFGNISAPNTTFYARVTDNTTLCFNTAPFETMLVSPPVANAGTNKQLDCNNPTVTLSATASTGAGSLSYLWETTSGTIVSGETTPSPVVSRAGTYELTVTSTFLGGTTCQDSDTVVVTGAGIILTANAGIDIALLCNDLVVLNGAALIDNEVETIGITYLWTGPGTILNPTTPSPTVNIVGEYTLEVTFNDSSGAICTDIGTVMVNPPTGIFAEPAIDLFSCGDSDGIEGNGIAVFDLTINSAIVTENLDNTIFGVEYFTSISDASNGINSITNPSNFFNTTTPQTIYTRISNASNSCVAIVDFELTTADSTIISTDVTSTMFKEKNSITINVIGIGTYSYAVVLINENNPIASIPPIEDFQSNAIFRNLFPGEYEVFIRDINGCGIVSERINVFGIPNVFTPNEDGINDFWQIKGESSVVANALIYIFNRYGKLLKQISINNKGWDGTYNGSLLPSDEYWYSVTLNDGRILSGHFTLKR